MAVFRVEKNRGYTVMSNHHLRDAELSLKAKGLLSMMLSLPEEWNYTTRGLAAICKEGTDCIGSALKELEKTGYIVRNRLRDNKGKIQRAGGDRAVYTVNTREVVLTAERPRRPWLRSDGRKQFCDIIRSDMATEDLRGIGNVVVMPDNETK